MKILDLQQGTPEWKTHRATHFNASDAPAMLGVSPYKTRAELLREAHTGVVAEVDAGTQKRFDNGHRMEALARPLAEQIVGEELYPVVGSLQKLSASFDGLTMDERQGFEHKALNDDLRAVFRIIERTDWNSDEQACRELPIYHRAQMEQQLLVSGAERILFVSSEWDADGNLIEEHDCWYYPDAALRQQIIDGWLHFERDLAAYELPAAAPAAPVGKTPETLPALRIEVTGQVTASNLAEFKQTALATIRSVNRELRTDADFADAEKAVKWCADVESRLKAAKEHALSQTASIDALFKALDDIGAEARAVRLDLDKLVARRKVEVKEEAVARARRALDEHIGRLNAEIAPLRLPPITADFAGAIKGLKSVSSMQDRLDTVLATTKIAADASARSIRENLAAFKATAEGYEFLFADLGQVIHKAADDFTALLQARIAQHKAAEAERERKRAEALAAKQVEDARVAAIAEHRRQDAAAGSARLAAVPPPPVAVQACRPEDRAMLATPAGAELVTKVAAQLVADEPATLKLGDINSRLAPLKIDAAGLSELGINPARNDGAAKLYRESDFRRMLLAILKHIDTLQFVQA